jgi:CheY-like chemotaxis protein
VLLAEDEHAIRSTFSRFLQKEGHRVLEAPDGQAALELFQEHAEAVGLVITDAMMPRMSGIELSRRVLEQRPELPIILISGYVSRELPELPATDRIRLLHKPFDLAELHEVVREMTGSNGKPR